MTATMEQIRFWSPWLLSHWLWPMLWQSSVLIGALFLIDFGFRRKLRKTVASIPLYTRLIKVDPNTFEQGLEGAIGFDWLSVTHPTIRPNDPSFRQALVRQFFLTLGIDLNPPKSIYLKDREGILIVRASLQDLDTMENAIQLLNITPPQIHIKAKFIAVPIDLMSELESKVLLKPDDVPLQVDMLLTVPQTKVLLKALESNSNVDVINESSVTTLTGRQTQISIEPEPLDLSHTNKDSLPGFGIRESLTNRPPSVQLDVLAFAHANESRIEISGAASVTELLSFDYPGKLTPTNWDTQIIKGDAVITRQDTSPLPHFRTRQLSFNNTLWDGQTLLLGGFLSDTQKTNSVAGQSKKSLLVLITPTLIDPAGNRTHPDNIPPK